METTTPIGPERAPSDDERERWQDHYRQAGERDADFETLSGEPLQAALHAGRRRATSTTSATSATRATSR